MSEDRLTCFEVWCQLARYLDADLNPVEMYLVDEHLERCPGCRRKQRFEQSLLDGIRSRVAEVVSPPRLRARVRELLAIL